MAQAGIALAKLPLASPQPTAPPHPRDLARQLYQRQNTAETCGYVDGDYCKPQKSLSLPMLLLTHSFHRQLRRMRFGIRLCLQLKANCGILLRFCFFPDIMFLSDNVF